MFHITQQLTVSADAPLNQSLFYLLYQPSSDIYFDVNDTAFDSP
jgi:hypothetical protein